MKKHLIILTSALFLVGCGNGEGEQEPVEPVDSNVNDTETVEGEQEKPDEVEEEDPELEEESAEEGGTLDRIGQKITEHGQTVELMAVKEINETIDLSPIELTIESIKIIRMSDITNADTKNWMSQFTDKEEFDYIQIMYEIENTEDRNVRLNSPIEAVVLNTGEQIESYEKDFSNDPNFAKTLYGKVKNESMVTLIIESSEVDEIEEIRIVTGRIDDGDTASTLVEVQTVTYDLD